MAARKHRYTPVDVERNVSASASASDSAGPSEYNLGPVLGAVGVACAGAFAFGYHLGVVNGPLETIANSLGFGGSKALEGLVVSITLLGAAIGSLTGGGFADALGRTKSFLLCSLPLFVGPLLSATAQDLNAMLAGRFLAGIGIGLSSALVPLYISEVSPTKIRGVLGSLNQLMINVGILTALVVNVAVPVAQWRTMFYIAAAPAVVLFAGMLFASESPTWLAAKGERAAAETAAYRLWGASGDSQLSAAKPDSSAPEQKGSWTDVFSPAYAKGVGIGCILFAFQQFSGINALVYFSSSVFRAAGIASDTLASAAVGATNLLGTIIATGFIESAGRKQLLTQSYSGMALAMLVMAAGFSVPALKPLTGTIALVGTLLYILSFAYGAGPVTGLIVPEVNNARVRASAVSAAMVTHWVCNMAIGQSFMGAVATYGLGSVYAVFGLVALGAVVYVRAYVPETKGKSFEQIEAELKA